MIVMGRNKVVKRFVLFFLLIISIISILIFFNLYFISTSELQTTFPAWEYIQEEEKEDPFDLSEKDPEIIEVEKRISYILKLYKDGKQPNLGLNLDDDFVNKKVKNPVRKNIDFRRLIADKKEAGSSKFKHAFEENSQSSRHAKYKRKVTSPIKKKSRSVPGILNAHIWEGWCGPRVEDLKRDKHFPLYPSFKTNLTLFFAQWNEAGYGERIFGYLIPPETGNYIFAVSCDDNCEIWLSNSSDPHHVQKIAYVGTLNTPANTKLANFRQYQSQISKQIYLIAGNNYYIEALHKQAAYKDHLLLTWLAPSWQRIRTISSKYISSYISGELDSADIEDYALYIPESPATVIEQIYNNIGNIYYFNRTKYKFGSCDKRFQNVSSNLVESSDFINILPSFEYKPSYVIDFVPRRYEGVKLIHESSVYPNDNTALTHMYSYEDCLTHRQNHPHLSGLFSEASLKTSIDEENWFSQLTFDKKFKYLLNLYNKKIRYIVHQHNLRSKTKKSDDALLKNKKKKLDFQSRFNVKGVTRGEYMEKSSEINNGKSHSYKGDIKKGEYNFPKRSVQVISSNFRARKLLNFVETDAEANISENKLSQEETDSLRKDDTPEKPKRRLNKRVKGKNTNSKTRLRTRSSVEYESNSDSNVDNDVLPRNLLENSIRDNPISIPAFVKSTSTHNDNPNHIDTHIFKRNTQKPFVTQIIYKKLLQNKQRNPLFRSKRRTKIQPMIIDKVYFKDGVFFNGTNTTAPDHQRMGYLYNIFGSAIYHLSQVPERYFQWMYNQHLSDCKTDGNMQLSEEIAISVVHDFTEALKSKHGSKYSLKRIVNVEENHDVIHGDRYLIEIDLNVENQDKPQHLSRYIYRPLGSHKLYEINDFQWNPHATVHIIIPVKDQGRWVKHFILNMEKIYTEKKDPYLNIILVDFNSTDIDIERCLQKSQLKRYQVVSLDGPFQRALGVQAGVDAVKNPNDIIFTCDLHLEIPSQLIESIRKHTIKGKMAFAPMVFRLSCGYTPELPFGLWEIQGYGLFAISKYDFDRIGGMNTKEFKTKWGGEDWEFLDRVLEFGLEVERMRIPHFYHYYHSKKRMWVAPKTTLPPMVNVDSI